MDGGQELPDVALVTQELLASAHRCAFLLSNLCSRVLLKDLLVFLESHVLLASAALGLSSTESVALCSLSLSERFPLTEFFLCSVSWKEFLIGGRY